MDRKVLLNTLAQAGVGDTVLSWIASYLSGRLIQTKVEGSCSPRLPVTSGVPQGSVLGPLLFIIHYSNIPSATKALNALFAYDVLLYRSNFRGADQTPC